MGSFVLDKVVSDLGSVRHLQRMIINDNCLHHFPSATGILFDEDPPEVLVHVLDLLSLLFRDWLKQIPGTIDLVFSDFQPIFNKGFQGFVESIE